MPQRQRGPHLARPLVPVVAALVACSPESRPAAEKEGVAEDLSLPQVAPEGS